MRRAVVLLALVGCRAPYVTLAHAPPAELGPVSSPVTDSSEALPRVRALESRCRAGLSQQTFRQALAARDRVLTALGAACDMEEVAGDRLHWLFHCRSEALFGPGRFEFPLTAQSACPGVASLRGARVNPWVCAGAALHELEGSHHALGRLELAVVGHVDGIRVLNFNTCPTMLTAFGRPAEMPAAPTTDAEREAANDRLAWCRAASVADKIRCGLGLAERNGLAAGAGTGAPNDPCATLGVNPAREDLSVVGASTTWYQWFRGQPDRTCSPPVPGEPADGNCIEARRVDVFVRYIPTAETTASRCPHDSSDETSSLHCLQDCVEDATAHAESSAAPNTPLHVPCSATPAAAPPGWIGLPTPTASPTCRALDVGLVQRSLGLGG